MAEERSRLVGGEEATRAVIDLVRKHLGVRADSATRIRVGDNWVWDVQLETGSVILKSGAGLPALEAWGLTRAMEAGVRVPSVLGVGESASFPYRYLILSKLQGVPMTSAALSSRRKASLLGRVGAQLRRLHGLPTDGFGPPNLWHLQKTGRVRGTSPSWAEAITGWTGRLLSVLEGDGTIERDISDRIRATLDRRAAVLGSWTESRLLHGDMSRRHVLVGSRSGSVKGIIDFEGVLLGDPAYDLAVMTFREPRDLDAILKGYGADPPMEKDLGARLDVYRLHRAMLELRWGAAGRVGASLMRLRRANLVEAHLALDEAVF